MLQINTHSLLSKRAMRRYNTKRTLNKSKLPFFWLRPMEKNLSGEKILNSRVAVMRHSAPLCTTACTTAALCTTACTTAALQHSALPQHSAPPHAALYSSLHHRMQHSTPPQHSATLICHHGTMPPQLYSLHYVITVYSAAHSTLPHHHYMFWPYTHTNAGLPAYALVCVFNIRITRWQHVASLKHQLL